MNIGCRSSSRIFLGSCLLVALVIAPLARAESFATAAESSAALKTGEFTFNPKWLGVHPRLLTDPAGLQAAIAEWKVNPDQYAGFREQRGFPAQKVVALEVGAHGWDLPRPILLTTVLYILSGEEAYAERLHNWIVNGYAPGFVTKPNPIVIPSLGTDNKDLAAGQLLYCTAAIYDLISSSKSYREKYPQDLEILEKTLLVQGAQTYRDLAALRRPWYEQNHFYIAAAGLGMTAVAIYDKKNEFPEIEKWALLAVNMLRRSKETLSSDGFYYESVGYWGGFYSYMTSYAEMLLRVSGEDWLTPKAGAEPTLLTGLDAYLAHMSLPVAGKSFGYGDHGPRRPWKGYDRPVTELQLPLPLHPMLELAEFAPSSLGLHALQWQWESQKAYAKTFVDQMDAALTLLKLPVLKKSLATPLSMAGVPTWHYFDDHEIIVWRNAWTNPAAKDGTALFFKCGSPEGHLAAELLKKYPDWKLGMGHAHPDAGSFSLFAKGAYLASDPGYLASKVTAAHNCVLIDGKGQFKEGTAWETFSQAPYSKYDKLRFKDVWLASTVAAATADVAAAYDEALKLERYERQLIMVGGRWIVVRDSIAAPAAHTYSWVLNSEKPFQPDGEAKSRRWMTESGDARLIVQSLNDIAKSETAPTEVNVGLFSTEEMAVRSHHLSLALAPATAARFTNVLGIQGAADNPKIFSAVAEGEQAVLIRDGSDKCVVLLGTESRLTGSYGYIWTDGNRLNSCGFQGTRLVVPEGRSLSLNLPGKFVLQRNAGKWQIESDLTQPGVLTVEENGKAVATVKLPTGVATTPVDLKWP